MPGYEMESDISVHFVALALCDLRVSSMKGAECILARLQDKTIFLDVDDWLILQDVISPAKDASCPRAGDNSSC